jgi:hypothetical protein
MAGTLLLGPVLFRDFEVPERIVWGGTQRLAVHCFPGGRRVIDAMGRDDAPIGWTGIFSGGDAAARARLLDLMRADGGAWPLTWGGFLYSVVVSAFVAEYERANWIPYRIVCTVLRDEIEAVAEAGLSVLDSVAGDLAAADGLGAGLDLSGARAALAAEGAARRGGSAHAAALAALGGGAGAADLALLRADGAMASPRIADAGDLAEVSDRSGALASSAWARGYTRRAYANLRNADS